MLDYSVHIYGQDMQLNVIAAWDTAQFSTNDCRTHCTLSYERNTMRHIVRFSDLKLCQIKHFFDSHTLTIERNVVLEQGHWGALSQPG